MFISCVQDKNKILQCGAGTFQLLANSQRAPMGFFKGGNGFLIRFPP